ncbi:hypothetical protein RFI_17898, partial [Reticulomyxa filosa]
MVVNYDIPKSVLRNVQRSGRTGRRRVGRCIYLMTGPNEEQDYNKYKRQKQSILDIKSRKYTFYSDAPRMFPKAFFPALQRIKLIPPTKFCNPLSPFFFFLFVCLFVLYVACVYICVNKTIQKKVCAQLKSFYTFISLSLYMHIIIYAWNKKKKKNNYFVCLQDTGFITFTQETAVRSKFGLNENAGESNNNFRNKVQEVIGQTLCYQSDFNLISKIRHSTTTHFMVSLLQKLEDVAEIEQDFNEL